MVERLYPYNDAIMLTGGKVVAHNLRVNVNELSEIRSGWNRVYSTNLDRRLDFILDNVVGFPSYRAKMYARFNTFETLRKAARDLFFFKVQIEVDFMLQPEKLDNYFDMLHFASNQGDFSTLTEEKIIDILNAFNSTINDCRMVELVGKGINPNLIRRIKGYAEKFSVMMPIQEELKNYKSDLNVDDVEMLNGVYNELIGVCIIAKSFFRNNEKKQQLFIFPEIVLHLEGLKKSNFSTH